MNKQVTKPGDTITITQGDMKGMTVKVVKRQGANVFVKSDSASFWIPLSETNGTVCC